ncbi:hypothetical protein WH43_03215 [Rheinheimera sp. KL1]|nr:hypothetical protein WH43_03215 [Rheinheimera sp. KL1]
MHYAVKYAALFKAKKCCVMEQWLDSVMVHKKDRCLVLKLPQRVVDGGYKDIVQSNSMPTPVQSTKCRC